MRSAGIPFAGSILDWTKMFRFRLQALNQHRNSS